MERLFTIILIGTIAVFFLIGSALHRMGKGNLLLDKRHAVDVIHTSFIMDEPRPQMKKEPPRPRPVERKKIAEEPVDLTKKQEVAPTAEAPPPQPERQVRQVYGLRKVFSQGLGAGGASDDAIVGRIGNTLEGGPDTLTATAEDLKGRPVADPKPRAAAPPPVTKRPQLKSAFRRLKPQYSQEMLQNRVEGVVKARLLIGVDGIVKQVEITEDIGYDSAEIAREFLLGLQFEPAMRGDEPVTVWIPFSIRFELI